MTRTPPADRIHLCRAHDLHEGAGAVGARLLVDRLWPSGMTKSDLPIVAWLEDITPSPALRKGSRHGPTKWGDFGRGYLADSRGTSQTVEDALVWRRNGTVTLICAAEVSRHTHAPASQNCVAARLSEDAGQ